MGFTNADKARHGQSFRDSLENILKRAQDAGYIVRISADYRIGKDAYTNQKQFYAPFLIEFADGEKWALFCTTSMRSDRIKGQQWDAINLKEIDPSISHVYLIHPDGIPEWDKKEFRRQNQKYFDKTEYSAIDAIVSQDGISNLIEANAIRDKTKGQIKDIQGNSFERRVADCLSFEPNLLKWKGGNLTVEGMYYDLFKSIVECFGLDVGTVLDIRATADKRKIGRLPSGGNPKTDVLVTVTYTDGAVRNFTISCKRSSNTSVSVHQYDADTFADVLDQGNGRLRELLRLFQQCGNLRDFGPDNQEKLAKELAPYLNKLCMWVLGGQGGDGDPETQNAEYLLTYDNRDGSSSIHSVEAYCRQLLSQKTRGHFGTPFYWTYPSKGRGKNIQLKCRIIK